MQKSMVQKNLLVASHFGLGDHIVINGLIRKRSENYQQCVVLVRRIFLSTLSELYCDLDNIRIIGLHPDFEGPMTYSLIDILKDQNYDFLRLGYFGSEYLTKENMKFDEAFYHQAKEDFDFRWSNFNYTRNLAKENELYRKLECDRGNYVFLHEDIKRNFIINRSFLPNHTRIIEPNLNSNYNIFHYRKVLEHAKEIHCIESSFSAFIESIGLRTKLFAHRYCRPEARTNVKYEYTYRLPWKIYT